MATVFGKSQRTVARSEDKWCNLKVLESPAWTYSSDDQLNVGLLQWQHWALSSMYTQARSQGGVGGVVRPPPVAHPKDFVPPFSNFVPPFSNFVPPFSNFVPPFSNFVPPFSNFVPPFSNFVPPLEYVDDVTRAMSKGGVLVNVQEWGRFSNWWRHAGNVQGGGCAWCSTHPSSDPPHLAGWLRACIRYVQLTAIRIWTQWCSFWLDIQCIELGWVFLWLGPMLWWTELLKLDAQLTRSR